MTREEILAYQARTDAFSKTLIGAAFFKFKHATERAWIADTEDSLTDKDRASTKRYHEEMLKTEKVLRELLEPICGMQS